MSLSDVFNHIYKTSRWGYKSGPGSDPVHAEKWINIVNNFLENASISSVLDIGCGDFRLGSQYNLTNKTYIGVDISEEVLKNNTSTDNISFILGDALDIPLPAADLVLLKDVLQHLPIKESKELLHKATMLGEIVLVCNDYSENNRDIIPGGYRGINLTSEPYDIPTTKLAEFFTHPAKKAVYVYYKNKELF